MRQGTFWDKTFGTIRQNIPEFNTHLLKRYRKESLDEAIERLDLIFSEAMQYIRHNTEDGDTNYMTCSSGRVLTPEERIDWIMNKQSGNKNGYYNIGRDEVIMVGYQITYNGIVQDRLINIYLPYLFEGNIVLGGTRGYVMLYIVEDTIYRSNTEITIKVMQKPLKFELDVKYKWPMTTVGGKNFQEAMIVSKLHSKDPQALSSSNKSKKAQSKKQNKKIKTPLFIYFLAQFGFEKTMEIFKIKPDEIIINQEDDTMKDYYTFSVNNDCYIHVAKVLMNHIIYRRIVAVLHYLLTSFTDFKDVSTLFGPDALAWRIMLGKIYFGENSDPSFAHSQAMTHLIGVSDYLDPIIKRNLKKLGIECENIFDLLILLFTDYDGFLNNHEPNNIYEKKIECMDLIMPSINNMIFGGCYKVVKNRPKMDRTRVEKFIRSMRPRSITDVHRSGLTRNLTIYNDNELLNCMGKKVRQPANQKQMGKKNKSATNSIEYFFHPSFPVVESSLTISNSNPCISGSINPYALIDKKYGYILRPDYAEDIEVLNKYLPKR